jgi:predicted dinucleotide-binding enzyme
VPGLGVTDERRLHVSSPKKVGVLGSGVVGQTLAGGFVKHGFETMIGSREPDKLAAWAKKTGSLAKAGSVEEAARFGDIVVLAVKGTAAEEVVRTAGAQALAGKVVIDATNPIADAPPAAGLVKFFTSLDGSMMESLQEGFPKARFVKAFNSVGSGLMVNPKLRGGPPTMFICGNDGAAKKEVADILERFGWEAEDLGTAEAARAIEPLCILWCIPGFLKNDWAHAFKVLRP